MSHFTMPIGAIEHEQYEDRDANDAGNYRPPARTCPTCGMPVDKACGRETCLKLAEFARTGRL